MPGSNDDRKSGARSSRSASSSSSPASRPAEQLNGAAALSSRMASDQHIPSFGNQRLPEEEAAAAGAAGAGAVVLDVGDHAATEA